MQSRKWQPFCLGLNVLRMDHALIQNSARFSRQIRFLQEKCRIAIQISMKFVDNSPIHKTSTCDKPLSEPMMTWFTFVDIRLVNIFSYLCVGILLHCWLLLFEPEDLNVQILKNDSDSQRHFIK